MHSNRNETLTCGLSRHTPYLSVAKLLLVLAIGDRRGERSRTNDLRPRVQVLRDNLLGNDGCTWSLRNLQSDAVA